MAITVTERVLDARLKQIDETNETARVYECPVCGKGQIHVDKSVFYGRCNVCEATLIDFKPLPHQQDFLSSNTTFKLLIGGFGCSRITDKVLMYDGSVKMYKDLKVGDLLMGKDSTPRKILHIHSGEDEMYEVKFKGYDTPLYVTGNHELYLRNWTYKYKGDGTKRYRRHLRDSEDIFIKVSDYMRQSQRFKKDNLWIFSEGVDFESTEVPLDPYFLGLLLGDGSFVENKTKLTTTEDIFINMFPHKHVYKDARNGVRDVVYDETITDKIRQLGLSDKRSHDKFIPTQYKINSREVRLQVLAGLIDSDGHASNGKGYEITLKSEQMVDDIVFIGKSLGMKVSKKIKKVPNYPDNTYYRVHISGYGVDQIPVRLERKKLKLNPNKRHNLRAFTIKKISDSEPFIGITVDVDNLYVEGIHFSILKNSGKTTVACYETAYHALTTPNGATLLTAPTLQQMKEAILPELNKFLPPWFLEDGRAKGNPPVYTLTNGHRILVYPSNEEQKIRSLNLTRFHIEEGSGVEYAIFSQLQTRLRSHAGIVRDSKGREIGNKFSGIVSTNPEISWVLDDFLLKCKKINGTKHTNLEPYEKIMHSKREDEFEAFISTSFDNTMLPRGTIERISAGKDDRWKRKYLYSILDQREGLVYPDMPNHYVEPFHIPHHWKRIAGYDPGTADPTAMLIGAIDPTTNIIYFYHEYYVTDQTIPYHAEKLNPYIKPYQWLKPIQADPSVRKRSAESGQTYASYFKKLTGITLSPANNDILLGIDKVRTYLYKGRIKIFNNLENFKREASLYQFPSIEERDRNTNNKPIDKYNHLMDCLRYVIVGLPENPDQFTPVYLQSDALKKEVYSAFGVGTMENTGKDYKKVVYGFRRGG